MFCLKRKILATQVVFFGYERHWLSPLTFSSTVLIIPHSGTILDPLHKDVRPKLKIMGIFQLIIRNATQGIGGFNLHSLETTSGVQDIQHIVSMFTSDTPSKLLI